MAAMGFIDREQNLRGIKYSRIRFMVFNTTINDISIILWRSVFLFVEESRVTGENHLSAVYH
jgi:hypothetical protein